MINKRLKYLIPLSVIILGICLLILFNWLSGLNIHPNREKATIYIPDEATYEEAMDSVKANLQIRNIKILEWVAQKKKYAKLIKPG